MGSKGNKRHVKRLNTPKNMPIEKKAAKYFYNTRAGPHPKRNSIPLGSLLRDVLKVVDTHNEARKILNMRKILVDGIIRTDSRFPVGLMDVVEIPDLEKTYRILPKWKKGLVPYELEKNESSFKLCRIENKSIVKNGNIQLNLHDGRNIHIPVKDPKKPKEDIYKTMGVLKIKIPSQEIVDYYPLKENSPILVMRGKNLGMNGIVTKIEKRYGPNASIVTIKTPQEETHETAYAYSFVVGKIKPAIKLE
ncbi:MAG: 30S ribosomal protein S4e [Candidatus Lokiarchaeota archaeon]|nr:30S ribosomal protein S4e [Candidatus Lokiarchaeota archaeon]